MSKIGEKIRAAREAKGWSQEELANTAGVSQTTIDKIERGLTKRSRFLHYITSKLELDPSELDPEMYPSGSPTIVKDLPETVERLRSYDKNLIPVYSLEISDSLEKSSGIFVELSNTPLDFVQAPSFLNESGAYAIYMSEGFMFPEVDPGDLLIFDPRLPFVAGSTCVFVEHGSSRRLIGRLAEYDKDFWTAAQWAENKAIKLSRKIFPRLNRVAAKFYRR
jgi:transcriptional regulator with XRE-family HTH domain